MTKTPEQFMEYFRDNYPGPRTIIANPDWHAPKIYRAAIAASTVPALVEALTKLANEAAGFLSLSDVERHGMTNSRILRDRIEQARDAIRLALPPELEEK